MLVNIFQQSKVGFQAEMVTPAQQVVHNFCSRGMTTAGSPAASDTAPNDVAPRIKFKRLDKTAKHIMQACRYFYLFLLLFFILWKNKQICSDGQIFIVLLRS